MNYRMRLLVTADLHYNHPRSRPLAEELIDRMNRTGGDVLLVVGDTAAADGDALEQCLSRFQFAGPKLFVAGNHELWTHGPDSHAIFRQILPQRVRALGWHWLEDDPFVESSLAIVGSVGWYDYTFAPPELGIPTRFFEAKIAPGSAERQEEYAYLFPTPDDVPAAAREVIARWNDGKFVKLHRSDVAFLDELLQSLRAQLDRLKQVRQIVAAVHHLPFSQLLPPRRSIHWDFARAYLGSDRIGQLLKSDPRVTTVLCGHSHFPMQADIDHIHAINIGSGYGSKEFLNLELNP